MKKKEFQELIKGRHDRLSIFEESSSFRGRRYFIQYGTMHETEWKILESTFDARKAKTILEKYIKWAKETETGE